MSIIGAPLAVLVYLVPLVVVGAVLYLAVRFGVSHGLRDAYRKHGVSALGGPTATSLDDPGA